MKHEDVKTFHPNGKELNFVDIPVDDPKVYTGILKFQWRELTKGSDETRCKIADGTGGFISCRENCSNCTNLRNGKPDSLENEEEINGYENVDESQDRYEIAELRIILEGLFERLRKINADYADILEKIYHEQSQEEISLFSGKSTGTIGEKTLRALALARKILEEEGFVNPAGAGVKSPKELCDCDITGKQSSSQTDTSTSRGNL